jgi:hypothetical protein
VFSLGPRYIMAPKIDHIIILLPYNSLQNPPQWLTKHFTLTPGGRHKDNRTENKLIVFRDGSYIELIAFIDDDSENRKGHWWGQHPNGLMDWALTSNSAEDVKAINDRLTDSAGPKYADGQEGGRERPDGKELKWVVTFPENVRRGEVPFWCHDVSSRDLRVPTDVNATNHPCGAVGVGNLTIVVPPTKMANLKMFYDVVLGPNSSADDDRVIWEIEAFNADPAFLKPAFALEMPQREEDLMNVDDGYAVISEISLLTDTIGLGQSRETIIESLGGEDLCINFVHGRRK